jgi:hypothetical protein
MSLNQFINPNTLNSTISCRGLQIQNNNVVGYSPGTLNAYSLETKTGINVTGFNAPVTTSLIISRVGNVVTFNLPELTGVSSGTGIVLQGAIDIRYRPAVNLNFVPVVVDTVSQVTPPNQLNGHVDLNASTGDLTFYRTANELVFNLGATAGYRALSFSYICT